MTKSSANLISCASPVVEDLVFWKALSNQCKNMLESKGEMAPPYAEKNIMQINIQIYEEK